MDLHYLNPTENTLQVSAAVNIGTVPENEVTDWVSTLQFDSGPIDVEQGITELVHTCHFEQDLNVLSLMGHMHDFGHRYQVDWLKEDQSEEIIYNVEEWSPDEREYPTLSSYDPGEVVVKAGEEFRTTCSWNNQTGGRLADPAEMCTTVIVVYPMEHPKTCIMGQYRDD